MFPPSAPHLFAAESGRPKRLGAFALWAIAAGPWRNLSPAHMCQGIRKRRSGLYPHRLRGPAAYQHVHGTNRPHIAASWPPILARWLAAQSELLDQRAVTLWTRPVEVTQHPAALTHHHEQPAARVKIVLVL